MPPKLFLRKSNTGKEPRFEKTGQWLIIVESPSKCKKIEEYLGQHYQCIASQGHIRTIDGLKSIDTKHDFTPTFTPVAEKEKHIEIMRNIITKFPKDHVLIATDDDREGEAIGWHICDVFGLPVETTKRILFHEITKDAIRTAVDSPTTLNMSLIHAQHARQVLDMVVGYTISPILWKHICNDKGNGLSAGRCQTPALRLLYDHSVKNKARKVELQYKTTGVFFERSIRFDLNHKHDSESAVVAFLEKSKSFDNRLSMFPPKDAYKSPPKPFTTSRLLQTASSVLRYSPKTTMSLCQSLYQMGLITYMRTDSGKYSPVFLKQAETYILREWSDPRYLGDIATLENSESGNPHEAIRATNIHMPFITDENKQLVSMYRFIWKNTIESCMSTAIYKTRAVRISAPEDYSYEYTLEIPVFMGWKRVSSENVDGVDMAQHQTGLQMYFENLQTANQIAMVQYIESVVSPMDSGTKHYTEASLIQTLEELGIGRPSTYASIVETIQERGYVKKRDIPGTTIPCSEYKLHGFAYEFATSDGLRKYSISVRDFVSSKNLEISSPSKILTLEKTEKERVFGQEKDKLVIQPTGVLVVEFLLQYFDGLFSYDYTKTMESHLDEVSNADPTISATSWREICRECYAKIKTLKKPLTSIKRETYVIEKDVELVFHTNGASLKRTLEDGTVEYKAVKKNMELDLGKVKRGEYSTDDLVEIPEERLGVFDGNEVLLKSGKYGAYVVCGNLKVSVKHIPKSVDTIQLGDVIALLEMKKREKELTELGISSLDLSAIPDTYQTPTSYEGQPSIRTLTPEMSVRSGKYGAYIYYQKTGAKKPTFLNIKKFKEDCWTCNTDILLNWLRATYTL